MSFYETALFFRTWWYDPRRIGAVLPSSPQLANLITFEVTRASAPIIELGPGTGVFTRALLARGIREDQLALIENNAAFAQALQSQFPSAEVLVADAARLRRVRLFEGKRAGAVVSGLPLLSMSVRKIVSILDASFKHLRADGAFYQFTYGPRCPIPQYVLNRLGLKAQCIGSVLMNLPPAAVYRIHRKAGWKTMATIKTLERERSASYC